MKSEITNAVLTIVLGVLVVAGVFFALRTIFLTHEFRQVNAKATQAQSAILQAQALVNDVAAYNQKNPSPELTRLLQAVQEKTAAH